MEIRKKLRQKAQTLYQKAFYAFGGAEISRAAGLWDDPQLLRDHKNALKIYQDTQKYKHNLTDYESRLQEIVDFYGYEKGVKAPYCRVYGGESMPIREQLGITPTEYCLMHMVALLNRISPERCDLFYIFDFVLEQLDRSFKNRTDFGIVDLGCGHGSCGLAFCMAGYHVYFVDVQEEYLKWAEFACKNRGLSNYTIIHNKEWSSYPDFDLFRHPIAGVIEWSSFEHFDDPVTALSWVKDILKPSGVFISTTALVNWTEEVINDYIVDCGKETTDRLMSDAFASIPRNFFDIHEFGSSRAGILIRNDA